MNLNIVLDTKYREKILQYLNNKLLYSEIKVSNLIEPYLIFKDIEKPEDVETILNYQINHHKVIFIVNDSENMFQLLDQYPLCFIRVDYFEEDLQSAIELIKSIHKGLEDILTFKIGYSCIQMKSSQIVYIESMGHYLIVHTLNNQYQVRGKLTDVLTLLNKQFFTQIHKSFIINKKYIIEIRSKEVELRNHICLPIGRKFKNIT